MDDMGAFDCRLPIDLTNPFISAYRTLRECQRNTADDALSPGLTEAEAANMQKEKFVTIEIGRFRKLKSGLSSGDTRRST